MAIFYNSGIVDVSLKYEKMYVVRPPKFYSNYPALQEWALRNTDLRKDLVRAQEQNIDVTNFVEKLEGFKRGFARNYGIASGHFEEGYKANQAKSINSLETTKVRLQRSANQLRLANDKAQDITIRKLTHENSWAKEAFKGIKD